MERRQTQTDKHYSLHVTSNVLASITVIFIILLYGRLLLQRE